MPKTEIDYSNTVIYKITCKDQNISDLYVGNTTNFVQRKHAHKQSCTNEKSVNYKSKLYEVIRNNGGWDNWKMEIITFINCRDHYEARQKEQEYFISLNATLNSIEPMPKPKSKKKSIYTNDTNSTYEKNIEINIIDELSDTKEYKFICDKCDFKCFKQSDWNRHISSIKHETIITTQKHICIYCNKEYKTRVGLWYHNKVCKETSLVVSNISDEPTDNIIIHQDKPNEHVTLLTNLVVEVVKNNQELQKQSVDFQKQIIDMCKTMQSSINMNNCNNTNSNNTFNMQVFLNEECKDAMNMSDFINSFTVDLDDLENIGRLGYATGISNMIIKELKLLDIYKRPIHCSDLRREVFYVKDNDVWERETPENSKLKKAIQGVSKKNMVKLNDWRDKYPECMDVESHYNDIYVKLMMEVCGGRGDQSIGENKIIKNIAKQVVIKK